jgi:hypothetical protein
MHGLEDHGHVEIDLAQPRHAHEFGHAVDLGRARAALARLAVPPDREIERLRRLNAMYCIQHHHAIVNRRLVVGKLAA